MVGKVYRLSTSIPSPYGAQFDPAKAGKLQNNVPDFLGDKTGVALGSH